MTTVIAKVDCKSAVMIFINTLDEGYWVKKKISTFAKLLLSWNDLKI